MTFNLGVVGSSGSSPTGLTRPMQATLLAWLTEACHHRAVSRASAGLADELAVEREGTGQ